MPSNSRYRFGLGAIFALTAFCAAISLLLSVGGFHAAIVLIVFGVIIPAVGSWFLVLPIIVFKRLLKNRQTEVPQLPARALSRARRAASSSRQSTNDSPAANTAQRQGAASPHRRKDVGSENH